MKRIRITDRKRRNLWFALLANWNLYRVQGGSQRFSKFLYVDEYYRVRLHLSKAAGVEVDLTDNQKRDIYSYLMNMMKAHRSRATGQF